MKKSSVGAWGRPQPGEDIYFLFLLYRYIYFLFLCCFSVMALPSRWRPFKSEGGDGR